ncbi:hypothetical protein T4B_108 [Trichinella pseudospiralis]|uniref:Uncharacterized protein n=1 Tax=Trichinella pseudospiralis TaxID=6337 RepID=A0A0V1I9M9_TRIPS|nr:hypothetical protein T4E_5661 [Trichinella pseudospiralis]KRZ19537.1 hypothetical protein T4B_108 [Trichinella pseudospiralis]KRZ41788.1 hypothetical protein T4C_5447 [Trichinella pseudospiralis]
MNENSSLVNENCLIAIEPDHHKLRLLNILLLSNKCQSFIATTATDCGWAKCANVIPVERRNCVETKVETLRKLEKPSRWWENQVTRAAPPPQAIYPVIAFACRQSDQRCQMLS